MSVIPTAASRRTVMAGLLLLAAAAFGACEGGSPAAPEGPDAHAAAGSGGGPTRDDSVPGGPERHDTIFIPGDSVPHDSVPGDSAHVPGDTTHVPRDSTAGPDDSAARGILIIHVVDAADSIGTPVAGAVVTVSRGSSEHAELTFTSTASAAPMALSLTPGAYTVRLTALPPGWRLAAGASSTIQVRLERNGILEVRFRLTR